MSDFFSRLWFQFSSWRWLSDRSTLQRYVFGLLVPLIGILTYRLLTAKRRGRRRAARAAAFMEYPGTDSEFYLIEKKLNDLGFAREPWETFTEWIERLNRNASILCSSDTLKTVLNLHYRYRFDPQGLSPDERNHLRDLARAWLMEPRGLTTPEAAA
jgi:hypothetical protein